tara:strand:- start:34493 stop:34669 length:177 start_codon:yes stop_codon:yes gene_type:complete
MDFLLKVNGLNETETYLKDTALNDNKNASKKKKFIIMNASVVMFKVNINTLGAVKECR